MTVRDAIKRELERLEKGVGLDEKPQGFLVKVVARCQGNAHDVLDRSKEVLRAVLSTTHTSWPSPSEWSSLLPGWFVQACGPERTLQERQRFEESLRIASLEDRKRIIEAHRWSLAAWIQWFEPDVRYCFWWDARVIDADTVEVSIDVTEHPFQVDTFRWLLRASGALQVEEVE